MGVFRHRTVKDGDRIARLAETFRSERWLSCCEIMLKCIVDGRPVDAHRWLDDFVENCGPVEVDLDTPVEVLSEFGLDRRILERLEFGRIYTVGQLVSADDVRLLGITDIGHIQLEKIDDALRLSGYFRDSRDITNEDP